MASSLALGQATALTALGRIFLGLAQKLECLRSLQGAVDAFDDRGFRLHEARLGAVC